MGIMKTGDRVENFTAPPSPKGVTIDGDLVSLVPLNAGQHAADLFAANSKDSEGVNWTYMSYGPFATLEDYSDWVRGFEDDNDTIFLAIIRKSDEKAVGVASYLRINPTFGSIEVGHINYSPLLQNTTQGTEAMYLMMKWAFENGYRRYEWKCDALNKKSRIAAQRLGFSYEGVFRQMMMVKGRNRDTAWFAIIDKEWNELSGCFQRYLSKENFDEHGAPKVSLSTLTKPVLYKTDNFEFT